MSDQSDKFDVSLSFADLDTRINRGRGNRVNLISDKRVNPEGGVKLPKRTNVTGMIVYQSEMWAHIQDIVDYYFGPNHLTLDGFNSMPYTFGIDPDGTIRMFNDLDVLANPVPTSTDVAVLMLGCFRKGTETEALGVEVGDPTEAQIDSLRALWEGLDKPAITQYNAGISVENCIAMLRSGV